MVLLPVPLVTDFAEQKVRPAVVMQNDVGNRYSANVIIVPISSRVPEQDYPVPTSPYPYPHEEPDVTYRPRSRRTIPVANRLWALVMALSVTSCARLPHATPSEVPTGATLPAPVADAVVQLGGASNAVALGLARAYLGVGPRIVAFDITSSERMVAVGQSGVLPGVVHGLAVDPVSGLVWAALGPGGVAAVRTTDDNLTLVHHTDTPTAAYDVAVANGSIVAAVEPAALVTLSTDGALLGRYDAGRQDDPFSLFDEPKLGLDARGNLAFLAAGHSGLLIVDVADPRSPQLVGRLTMQQDVQDVALDGDLAYVSGYPLQIVDIADPARPRVVWPQQIRDDASMLSADGLAVGNGWAISNQQLIDVRQPEQPQALPLPGGVDKASSGARPAMRGTIAYLPAGRYSGGMRIVDVADPAAPRELWRAEMPGAAMSVEAEAGHLSLETTGDIVDVDVSEATAPRVVSVHSPDFQERLAYRRVVIDTATQRYVGDDGVLHVYDLAGGAPTASTMAVYSTTIQSNPNEMRLQGSHLYLSDSGWDYDIERGGPKYFEVVDIAQPDRPAAIGRIAFDRPLAALVVAGDTAWVAVRGDDRFTMSRDPKASEIVAIDITDPANPRERARVTAAGQVADLLLQGRTLHAATDHGWQRFDVGDGSRLAEAGSLALPGTLRGLAFADGMLWLGAWDAGVIGIPVGDGAPELSGNAPLLPVLVEAAAAAARPSATATAAPVERTAGAAAIPLIGHVGGKLSVMALDGATLFVGQDENVFAIDVSDPGHARFGGRSPILAGHVTDLAVRSGLVFAALGPAGLQVVDAQDPLRLAPVAGVSVAGPIDLLALGDDTLYTADATSGTVRIFNLADGRHPVPVGTFAAGGPILGLAVGDGTLLLARGRAGLQVVDVRQPGSAHQLGSLGDGLVATGVAFVDRFAYVVDGRRIVHSVDLSDPAHPRSVGELDGAPGIARIRPFDGRLALLNPESQDRVRIVDVSDPHRLRDVAHAESDWGRHDMAVRGEMTYLMDAENDGLYVVPWASGPDTQAARGESPNTDVTPDSVLAVLNSHVFRSEQGDDFTLVDSGEYGHIIAHGVPEVPRQAGVLSLNYRHRAVSGRYLLLGDRSQVGGLELYDMAAANGPVLVATASEESTLGHPDWFPPPATRETPSDGAGSSFHLLRTRYAAPKAGWDQLEREIVSVVPVTKGADGVPAAVFDIGYGKYSSDPSMAAHDAGRGLLVTGGPTLRVFDTRTAPAREIGRLELSGDGQVALAGAYAYRVGASAGIEVIDLHEPAAPRLVATIVPLGRPQIGTDGRGIAAAGGYLFLAEDTTDDRDDDAVVRVYDLADPVAPKAVDAFNTGAILGGVKSLGAVRDAVTVVGYGGLYVFRNSRARP
ncbi:MAG: type II toxin-antitoxin system PemK/MazF family toxin [Ardenticatenales bacterium]